MNSVLTPLLPGAAAMPEYQHAVLRLHYLGKSEANSALILLVLL